jgi:RecB family endonuclease NucS
VWLELKRSAEADAEQLRRYDTAMRKLSRRGRLALVTLDGTHLVDGPPRARYISWQDVARTAAAWQRADDADPSSHATRMTEEFLAYLEAHQLAQTGSFTMADAFALEHYEAAIGRLQQVISEAQRQLAGALSALDGPDATGDPRTREHPMAFWRTYTIDARAFRVDDPAASLAIARPGSPR